MSGFEEDFWESEHKVSEQNDRIIELEMIIDELEIVNAELEEKLAGRGLVASDIFAVDYSQSSALEQQQMQMQHMGLSQQQLDYEVRRIKHMQHQQMQMSMHNVYTDNTSFTPVVQKPGALVHVPTISPEEAKRQHADEVRKAHEAALRIAMERRNEQRNSDRDGMRAPKIGVLGGFRRAWSRNNF